MRFRNLTDWFDRVCLINCAHRTDRLERVREHITETGMADWDRIIVVPAVVGALTTAPADWEASRGAWGCLRSTVRIWEDAMHVMDGRRQMSLESVLILEDDVCFIGGALDKLNLFMENVPGDWGQIYLGGEHRSKPDKTGIPGILRGTSVNRTHAHAVSRMHIHHVYRHVCYSSDYRGTSKHIDHQLELAHQRCDWPVYCPEKWIAGQEAGTSDVTPGETEKTFWE